MPAGDGTGPMGLGPMTGRAAGYCAGYPRTGLYESDSGSRDRFRFRLGPRSRARLATWLLRHRITGLEQVGYVAGVWSRTVPCSHTGSGE